MDSCVPLCDVDEMGTKIFAVIDSHSCLQTEMKVKEQRIVRTKQLAPAYPGLGL